MKKFTRTLVALILGSALFTSGASGEIFPIREEPKEVTAYMPKGVYLAWSDGSRISDEGLVFEGGETKDIYVAVERGNDGIIDEGDFYKHAVQFCGEITDKDTVIKPMLEKAYSDYNLADITSKDFDKNPFDSYNEFLDELKKSEATPEKIAEIEQTVKERLQANLDGAELVYVTTMSLVEGSRIRPTQGESYPALTSIDGSFIVGRCKAFAFQQSGNQDSNFEPEFATVMATVTLKMNKTAGIYVNEDTLPSSGVKVETPPVPVEIRHQDTGGGGCGVGFGLLGLLALVPILAARREE